MSMTDIRLLYIQGVVMPILVLVKLINDILELTTSLAISLVKN